MTRMPQQNWPGGFQPQGYWPPQRPRRRRRVIWKFRWKPWILLPLLCLIGLVIYWLLTNVSLDIDLDLGNIFGNLPVSNSLAFGQLLLLAIGVIGLVLIIRLLRKP